LTHPLLRHVPRARARIGPEDFVAEEALPCILELIEESSRQEAELAAKWKREAELQELLINAVSSSNDLGRRRHRRH
jgi:hypothetical protein